MATSDLELEVNSFSSIDLFSGCGGLSSALYSAKFNVVAGVENNIDAAQVYSINFPSTQLFTRDIKTLSPQKLNAIIPAGGLDLLTACPPLDWQSTTNRANSDVDTNPYFYILHYSKILNPLTIVVETASSELKNPLFSAFIRSLKSSPYYVEVVAQKGSMESNPRIAVVASKYGRVRQIISNNAGDIINVAIHPTSQKFQFPKILSSKAYELMINNAVPLDFIYPVLVSVRTHLRIHKNRN